MSTPVNDFLIGILLLAAGVTALYIARKPLSSGLWGARSRLALIGAICLMAGCVFVSPFCCRSSQPRPCFYSHVGKYEFDIAQTKASSMPHPGNRLDTLKGLQIVFKADSTWWINRKVDLFEDTIGKWQASCLVEEPGVISYYHSPVKEQIGICRPGDTCFNAIYYAEGEGVYAIMFRKIKE